MTYIGRIAAIIVGIVFAAIFINIHVRANHFETVSWDMIGIIIVLVFLWFAGKQYDRARNFNRELQQNKQELQNILDSVDIAIWSVNLKTKVRIVSKGIQQIYGYERQDFYERGEELWKEAVHPKDRELVNQKEQELHIGKSGSYEYRIIRADKQVRWVQENTKATTDYVGNVMRIGGVMTDITERKQAEDTIKQLAYHDMLTGLPNRLFFHKQFTDILKVEKANQTIAVLFMDLDRFKVVNDTLGHSMGDLLLKQVASRLVSCVRQTDIVARLGGDEFIILLENASKHDTELMATKLIRVLSYPYMLSDNEIFITPSIGISLYPQDGTEIETLIKNADMAMYDAKNKGRNTYQFYCHHIDTNNKRKAKLESKLRQALKKQEFQVYYQPKVHVHTNKLMGMEALLRWNDPEEGDIPPGEFIPIAEETGLIIPIGEWVLREACRQNKAWQDEGYPPVNVCVNLSALQFREKELIHMVHSVLQEMNLEPRYLNLEVTETMAVTDLEQSVQILSELHTMGVHLSLDDFGTGYSSLKHLSKLPVHFIKIDKSFVWDFDKDEYSKNIVTAIINVSHSLNKMVIAEGVETKEQLEFLRQQQCDEAQGYYFSGAVPAEEAGVFFERYT